MEEKKRPVHITALFKGLGVREEVEAAPPGTFPEDPLQPPWVTEDLAALCVGVGP